MVGISYARILYRRRIGACASSAGRSVAPGAHGGFYKGDDAYHNGAFMLVANFSFYTEFVKQSNPVFPEKEEKFGYGTKDGYRFYLKWARLRTQKHYFHRQNPYWTDLIEAHGLRQILANAGHPASSQSGSFRRAGGGRLVRRGGLAGTLKTFRAIEAQSPETENKLVMGPWVHGGWQRGKGSKLGDISFGSDTGPFFEDEILLPFFRHHLKGVADPELPKAYVFETGKNVWQKEQQWPPAVAQPTKLYLHAGGKLSFDQPKQAVRVR